METNTNIPTTAPGATTAEADFESVLQMADTLTVHLSNTTMATRIIIPLNIANIPP